MLYSRRQFLNSFGYSTLLLSVAPALVSCTTLPTRPARSLPASGSIDPVTARILWHASLAPSGHNTQPWEVTLISPSHWRIGIPPQRRLPAVDPQGREALISLGAFIENLAQAAATQGLTAECQVLQDDPPGRHMLDLHLVSASGPLASHDSLERMQRRRVVKKGHRPEGLRSADVRWLKDFCPGQTHYLPRASAEADWLREGTVTSMAAQCQREDAMKELVEWVRFGATARHTHRDGLTTAGMEIEGMAGWLVDHFYQPEDVLKPSFRQQTVDITARMAGEGAGWLVMCSPGSATADLIETGRRFQQMFLQLRERNIACHPMSQMLEEEAGKRELSDHFGVGQIPQMLLRIGYVDNQPEPVSLRRPPQWFIKA